MKSGCRARSTRKAHEKHLKLLTQSKSHFVDLGVAYPLLVTLFLEDVKVGMKALTVVLCDWVSYRHSTSETTDIFCFLARTLSTAYDFRPHIARICNNSNRPVRNFHRFSQAKWTLFDLLKLIGYKPNEAFWSAFIEGSYRKALKAAYGYDAEPEELMWATSRWPSESPTFDPKDSLLNAIRNDATTIANWILDTLHELDETHFRRLLIVTAVQFQKPSALDWIMFNMNTDHDDYTSIIFELMDDNDPFFIDQDVVHEILPILSVMKRYYFPLNGVDKDGRTFLHCLEWDFCNVSDAKQPLTAERFTELLRIFPAEIYSVKDTKGRLPWEAIVENSIGSRGTKEKSPVLQNTEAFFCAWTEVGILDSVQDHETLFRTLLDRLGFDYTLKLHRQCFLQKRKAESLDEPSTKKPSSPSDDVSTD